MKSFLEIAITSNEREQELLIPTMLELGCQGFEQTDHELLCYLEKPAWNDAKFESLKKDLRALLNIISVNNAVRFREIKDMSEARAAEIIRESAILMSFGAPEGFGLPVAEAQASETLVIGYHGNGGREMLTAEYGFPIEVGQILTYAQTVERVLEDYSRNPTRLNEMAGAAAAFIGENYSPEAERQSILECWNAILREGSSKTS